MRVSLNLYTGLNFKTNFNGAKKDEAEEDIKESVPSQEEDKESDEGAFIPAIIKYPWIYVNNCKWEILPEKPKEEEKVPDYILNIEKLNPYIANTSPHEEFDGYPSTYEALNSSYDNFNAPIQMMKTPRQLVQYYADYANKVLRFDPVNANLSIRTMVRALEHRIDFEALGIDESDLSFRDKVKFAALFDFWSVTPDGEPRNGYERPDFVRSPKEYIDRLMANSWVYHALVEGKRLKNLYSYEVRKADDDTQKKLDEEYRQVVKERTRRPRAYRGFEPNKYLSPLNLQIAIAERRNDILMVRRQEESEESLRRPSRESHSDDMAQAWHEFLGGEWD